MNPLSRIAGRAIDRALGLPGPAVPYVVRRDVPVAMPDGVVLLGDHYRPAGPDRPLPVVLIRSPYGRGGASILFAAPLARRGFQVFIQSTRGTFGSGGQFRPFLTEREDGLATVAWVRSQLSGPHPVGNRALRRSAAAVGLAQHHCREDHRGLLQPRRPGPAERAELDRDGRPAGAWPARHPPEPAPAGRVEACPAEGPTAGRRRRRRGRAGRLLAGLHRARRP